MTSAEIVSRHFLRRRARAKATLLKRQEPDYTFYVRRASRGPFRWYVYRYG
jgi:hypothetical protein